MPFKNMRSQTEQLELMQKHLVDNAFDFLMRAISEFEKDDLKYSVIHFCSAVEQFLKARVMQNGWERVVRVNKKHPVTFEDFQDGRFQSIGLADCCDLLTRISDSEKKLFQELASHRNKVVHFCHPSIETDKVKIAQEQSRCWFVLKRFLDGMYRCRIEAIDGQRNLYHPWLQAVFNQKQSFIARLKSDGVSFEICPACDFESYRCERAEDSDVQHECLVCGLQAGNDTIGHCADCDSMDSIVQVGCVFYCMNCYQFCSTMVSCGHCGSLNTSLRQDVDGGGDVSAWFGCVECDGT